MKIIFRNISIFLSVLFFSIGNQIVFADEVSESFKMERGNYRKDILDYIQKNWKNFFGEKELEEYKGADIIFGEPYGVYSVDMQKMIATKFPVYVNGKCVQILDVFEDNDGRLTWSATISEDFLEKIDEIRQKEGKYRYETKDDPNGGAPTDSIVKVDGKSAGNTSNILYSNINKPILKIKVCINNYERDSRQVGYSNEIIAPMESNETQNLKPWCETYEGTKILSYEFFKNIKARNMMEWVYGSLSFKPDLYDKTLSFERELYRYVMPE